MRRLFRTFRQIRRIFRLLARASDWQLSEA